MGKTRKMFVIEYVDDDVSRVGIVHEKRGKVYMIEWIDFFDMLFFAKTGRTPSLEDCYIIPEQFNEIEIKDLESPRFFNRWESCLKEFDKYLKSRDFNPNVIAII